jgi:hypothetical protein
MTRGAARLVKAFLRRLVWSRTGAPLERQAEFNTALIRVTSEMLASDGASGPGLPVSDGLRAGSL